MFWLCSDVINYNPFHEPLVFRKVFEPDPEILDSIILLVTAKWIKVLQKVRVHVLR